MKNFSIPGPLGTRIIGEGAPTFIIAEMSANHKQDFYTAVNIVKAAAVAGADAIKLQTYTPDTMTLNSNKPWFVVGGEDNPDDWKGQTLYDLYKVAYTPWEWHEKLQKLAHDLGLIFFSTPFDETAVDFLESLNVPLYKIASYEVTDIPLLKRIAQTKKPVIMSTGYASRDEVDSAIHTLRQNGTTDIIILHCVTGYTDDPKLNTINLNTMHDIAKRYNVIVGFSDNNAGSEIPLQAVNMGASVIEKHVVSESSEGALDEKFSLGPQQLRDYIHAVRRAETIRGKVHYGPQSQQEEYNKRFRRSIFVSKDIKAGEVLTKENTKVIRPAFGLEPKHFESILGKKISQDIERGTPLKWEHIQNGINTN